jgi:RNA polymerase sigma factor (sigma-70 family)
MTDDLTLLREFAQLGSEDAFAAVVSKYIDLVYSVALRQLRDPALAQEVTQAVFIILARKARTLSPKTILAGWLCRTARNASANALTVQRRRREREQQYMQTTQAQLTDCEKESEVWSQIQPLLDAAMGQLGRKDHDALVLRFFEGRSFREVSAALGTSEAAAKMRVNRALGKMRTFFSKRGLTFSTAAIAGAVSGNSLQAAPIGLATSVTVAAVKGTSVTASTLTLIKITLKTMAYTKLKTVAAGSILVFCLAGTTGLVVEIVNARADGAKTSSPTSALAFAGFATPEAALKSFVWSESTGDLDKLLTACTPDQGERFKKRIAGMPQNELKRHMVEEASNRANYAITDKEVISDTEVRLHLRVQPYPGHPNVGNDVQVMQKIGNEWKYAGKYGVDIKD